MAPHGTSAPHLDDEPDAVMWQLRSATPEDCACLAEELRIHPATARVLAARGWNTPALATRFLNPDREDILDPSHLPDFDRAIVRTLQAIRNRESIMIFGDYDVDGLTATAILFTAIGISGGIVTWKIPHRLLDGYGMQEKHVEAARREGVRLIVTADSGIRCFSAIQCAKSAGIDVIITDHHLPEPRLPEAVAIVNPNRHDSVYGNRNLCGAGLAFQFAAGLFQALRMPQRRVAALTRSLLKLAAIGTVADVVPLVGENRAIVSLGLQGLAEVRNPGLRVLLDTIGIPPGRAATAREISFRLAPRINAAGRLEDASLILDLLRTSDLDEARRMVATIEKINNRRKIEQARVLADIAGNVSRSDLDRPVLVFSRQGWHRGVLGIVAARLVDEYHKPVFVLSDDLDIAHGSGRSIPGINLVGLLESTRHHLEAFGGHEQAAGLALKSERIDAFREEICLACGVRQAARALDVDSQLHLADAVRVWPEIARLEPFGNGNPAPIFATSVRVAAPLIAVSSTTWRLNVEQDGRIYQMKYFGRGTKCGRPVPGERMDVAYRLEPDSWRSAGFALVLEAWRPVNGRGMRPTA